MYVIPLYAVQQSLFLSLSLLTFEALQSYLFRNPSHFTAAGLVVNITVRELLLTPITFDVGKPWVNGFIPGVVKLTASKNFYNHKNDTNNYWQWLDITSAFKEYWRRAWADYIVTIATYAAVHASGVSTPLVCIAVHPQITRRHCSKLNVAPLSI